MHPTSFPPAPGATFVAGYMESAFEPAPDPLRYVHAGPEGVEGQLRVLSTVHSPAFALGLELMNKPHVVLLGMSPGNGFFSRKRVDIAVCGFAQLSGNVAVVVPDTIAIHTYRALGYTEREGRDRARKHGQLLKSRCRRSIELSRTLSSASVRLLDWDVDVTAQHQYEAAWTEVMLLFETHKRFRADILLTAQSFIQSRTTDPLTESALVECANYILKELAWLRICRNALGMDVLVPYHKYFAVAADFCDGLYSEPVPGVGWAVYDIDLFGETGDATGGAHVEQ